MAMTLAQIFDAAILVSVLTINVVQIARQNWFTNYYVTKQASNMSRMQR